MIHLSYIFPFFSILKDKIQFERSISQSGYDIYMHQNYQKNHLNNVQ